MIGFSDSAVPNVYYGIVMYLQNVIVFEIFSAKIVLSKNNSKVLYLIIKLEIMVINFEQCIKNLRIRIFSKSLM